MISSLKEKQFILSAPNLENWFILDPGILRKQPFLLALRRWGRFARRKVCDSGDTWGQFGCSWAAKAFKLWPCLRQETGTVLNYVIWYKWYCVAVHLDWLITFAPIFFSQLLRGYVKLALCGFPAHTSVTCNCVESSLLRGEHCVTLVRAAPAKETI